MIRCCVSSKIRLQDVVGSNVGREIGVWAQEGYGSGDSARRLDYAGRVENRGNLGMAIPWTHLLFQKSSREDLWINRVHIKKIIRHRKLRIRIVDMILWSYRWRIGFGWRSGLLIPKSQVLEDLFDDALIVYHTDYFHLSGAFWTR